MIIINMIIINSVISITISALKFEYADIGVSNLPVRKGLNCSRNVQVKFYREKSSKEG